LTKSFPFDEYTSEYEAWFDRNEHAYKAELHAVKLQLADVGRGIEIGVGTGRFAAPLGIKYGIDPSAAMLRMANRNGIESIRGVAEHLPFADESFDFALMVTTICFLDDVQASLREAYRVIRYGGYFVAGFIDKTSPVGQRYQEHKKESLFYKAASFHSSEEVAELLSRAGFVDLTFAQTIFCNLDELTENEPVRAGFGDGSFVVVRGKK
jgi:ubiquinone/menaquinone biosynthesis C-methylase UbiE